jgi:uncharacterized membrane protein
LRPNPIIADMLNELIVIGFDDTHTIFLVRAALARLQEGFGMATEDVAMVLRADDGSITVQQGLKRAADRNTSSTFWGTLADVLFAPESSGSSSARVMSEKRATVGMDTISTSCVVSQLTLCKTALLVRTRGLARRETVVGLFQGFKGVIARVQLGPEGQLSCCAELPDGQAIMQSSTTIGGTE